MRRGINIAAVGLAVWLSPAWAEDVGPVATAPDASRDVAAADSRPVSPATAAALKQEAYYHFFVEEYLTSATRLKLLEQRVRDEADTVNDVRLLRGSLYLAWGLHRPARTIFDQLVSTFPPGQDRNQVLALIERLQYSRSLYRAAVSTYKRLDREQAFASLDQATYVAGMSHYALGEFDQALHVLTAIPPTSAYRPFATLAAAKSHMQRADVAAAIRSLEDVGRGDATPDPERQALAEKGRVTLGLLLTEMGWYDNAIPVFASVPETSRFYPDAVFGMGWAHLYRKRYTDSLAAFQTLIRAAPDHPYALEALTTVGNCYDRMGARAKALEAYGTALDTYRHTQQTLGVIKTLISDRARLSELFMDFPAVMRSPLSPLLDDDGLRYWVKQYGELVALERYLTRKIDDTAVFDVMLDHRDEVFRERLPVVRQFLRQSPAAPLDERAGALQAEIDQAVRHESPRAWARGDELAPLDELSETRRRSRAVGAAIEQLEDEVPSVRTQRDELLQQWRDTNRRLDVLYGERTWKITTEIPGRHDDIQRALNTLREELAQAERAQHGLVASIEGVENQLVAFRSAIRDIRRDLVSYRNRLIEARTELLPPLQALLTKAVDQRNGRIEAMAAAARLNQLRLWDVASK